MEISYVNQKVITFQPIDALDVKTQVLYVPFAPVANVVILIVFLDGNVRQVDKGIVQVVHIVVIPNRG